MVAGVNAEPGEGVVGADLGAFANRRNASLTARSRCPHSNISFAPLPRRVLRAGSSAQTGASTGTGSAEP